MNDQFVLRRALQLDAVVSGAFGLVLLVCGPFLVDALGAPLVLLWPVAIVCLLYAAALWLIQARPRISGGAAWSIVALNLVWAAASVVLVVLGWLPLTALGVAFVILQAVVVAALADVQFVGLRRATA
jgi:hypothetical protein